MESNSLLLHKVEILIQQENYNEAEKTLKDLLSQDPNNTTLLSLYAEVNLQQDRFDQAKEFIENAIGTEPDSPHLFYIKSRIEIQQDSLDEAEYSIQQAIALDPFDADYFAILANIKLLRKQYSEALEASDKALEIDAENILGLNMRSTALLKLNRKEESFDTIAGALREDPNNAYTHSNYGWGLLEKGEHKKALEHFKEALQADPNFEYAQSGLLEALKAKNPIYRIFLKYAFFMGNLTSRYQWGIIIGFYIGFRVLRTIATSSTTLQPYLTPLIIVLALLAFSTWVINPIGNLFLRFNRYGQLLLSKEEKMSSNFVALSFIVFIIGLASYFVVREDKFLAIAVFGFTMMLPFGVMFSPSKPRNILLVFAVTMAVIGVGAIRKTFSGDDIFNTLSSTYIMGFVVYQWVANYLIIKKNN